MSIKMTQDGGQKRCAGRTRPGPLAIKLSQAILLFENAAPAILLILAPIMLLVAASLFELWNAAPQFTHLIAIAAALTLSGSIGWRRREEFKIPSADAAMRRLELNGAVQHDALRASVDVALIGGGPLWDAHVTRMSEAAKAARLAPPRPTANRVDRYGLRYAALATFVIGVIHAGAEAPGRILAGLNPASGFSSEGGIADLWIEPPSYTGRAPIYLLRGGAPTGEIKQVVDAPENSVVHVQAQPNERVRLRFKTAGNRVEGKHAGPQQSNRYSLALASSGSLSLKAGGRTTRWHINVLDDLDPRVAFVEPPKADRDGRLVFVVRIDDDFGAVSGALRLRLDPAQERPLDAPDIGASAKEEIRLVEVDGVAGPPGTRAFAVDLQPEPWAGLKVVAVFTIIDAAGQGAETGPATVTLPEKSFFNPLARAVIEQRQSLAIAPDDWRRAEWAFNGLTLGPEQFYDKPSDYLLMRTAMWRVNKEAGGDYKETVADFWPLALQLEDETLETARQRLESAKDALRDALAEGANDNEIEKLTEELRAALQQYLMAMAQSGAEPADGDQPTDEMISAADLDQMIDQVRDLAKSGARSAAEQALADLENLLKNLRRPGRDGQAGQGNGQDGEGGGTTGAVGDLIGRQRELADEAFDRSGKRGAEGDDLGSTQGGLASDLSELLRSLENGNDDADPGGEAARAFSRALGAMRRSEEALRAEEFDSAGEAMDRAIGGLREGAEALARAKGEQARAARGQGPGQGAPMRDPLGRPSGEASGEGVEVPEKSDAQRTRELLEELRRRLSEGGRSEEEIDYLQRLLERF